MNAATGLTTEHTALIVGVIQAHPEVRRAVLFGSRAKGCARPNSDIDLALYGDLDDLQAESIAHELDELPTPYLFDVKAVTHIVNPALLEHIERVGLELYAADGTSSRIDSPHPGTTALPHPLSA
jgi:predicted nucleotidyltransferase